MTDPLPAGVAAASTRLAEASRQLSSGGFRRGATSYSNAGAAAVAAAAAAGAAGVGAGAGAGASHPPQAGAAPHAPPTVGGAAAVGPTARDEAALDQARALRGRSASPNRHRGLGHDSGQSAVGGVRLGRGLTVDFEYPSPRGDVEDEVGLKCEFETHDLRKSNLNWITPGSRLAGCKGHT